MSGMWRWVPDGFAVVPVNPDDRQMMHGEEALDHCELREVYQRMVREAPDLHPNAGWKGGYPESGTYWLQVPRGCLDGPTVLGVWDNARTMAWHAPLPPLPKL